MTATIVELVLTGSEPPELIERTLQKYSHLPSLHVPPGISEDVTRAENLLAVSIMGLDLTLDKKVSLIEINGMHSGINGFGDIEIIKDDNQMSFRKIFHEKVSTLGTTVLQYIDSNVRNAGLSGGRLTDALYTRNQIKVPDYLIHPGWAEKFATLVENVIKIEATLNSKIRTDSYFDGMRTFKPQTHLYAKQDTRDILLNSQSEYFIIKPIESAGGKDISLVHKDDLKIDDREGFAIEEFRPSSPIENKGNLHYGCMRYMVMAMIDKSFDVQLEHFGGYWRLAPKPIDEFPDIDSVRANRCLGAISKMASMDEIRMVKDAVNSYIPVFYKRLVASS